MIFFTHHDGKTQDLPLGKRRLCWWWNERYDAAVSAALAFAVVVVVGSVGVVSQQHTVAQATNAHAVMPTRPVPTMPTSPHPFTDITAYIEGEAFVLYDIVQDRFLFTHNADNVLPLASVTKLMTALVAHESVSEGETITIHADAIETEGDSGLLQGEVWNAQDLIGFTLMTSSNDGAEALAASVGGLWQLRNAAEVPEYEKVDTFVDRMNTRARELGVHTLRFQNPSGLDWGNGAEGGVGNVRDVARLLAYIYTTAPELLEHTQQEGSMFRSESDIEHYAYNTNPYVTRTQGVLGSKTGYTNLAGGNLAVVFDAGLAHPVVAVTLGASREGRFTDIVRLQEALQAYIESGWYAYEQAIAVD
jgi:D-alanyl-D-alanine carboxypeptidase